MNYTEMKEIIDGAGDLSDDNQEIFDEINEMVEEIEQDCEDLRKWELSEEEYDDALDDMGEMCRVGSLEYYPSDVLACCDPIAYNIGRSEEEDYQKEQMKDEISDKIDELENSLDEEDEELIETLRDELDEAW